MIEKIITSKTRVKLLNLFLANIDDRYYLRELERKLDESLSPLRRQLMKLTEMGILVIEEEANIKYYRLNKNFAGIDELRRLVMGEKEVSNGNSAWPDLNIGRDDNAGTGDVAQRESVIEIVPANAYRKASRNDIAVLTILALFVLATASFVVYTSSKNIKQVGVIVSEAKVSASSLASLEVKQKDSIAYSGNTSNEMASKRWKVFSGSVPVLSEIESNETERGREL